MESTESISLRDRSRSDFLKWLAILRLLIDSAPPSRTVWQQTVDYQELLAVLARQLGFKFGPIERRVEKFDSVGDKGIEIHERDWIVATEPSGESVAERFEGWIGYPEKKWWHGDSGGLPHPEFRQEVLDRLDKWRDAVGQGK